MNEVSESTARRKAAANSALRDLCFADPLFRERYEGWCLLGWGSYATVVRTHSRDLGRDIALKIFFNLEPGLLERVRQEVRASQRLRSPYVVDTHSMFDRGVLAWFEMELVEGPNLDTYVKRHTKQQRALDADECVDIALAVSWAVWHAHRRGVRHRDLKPSNILISDPGPAPKVGDFGIARVADTTLITPRGKVTGTPRFASPEALAGRRVGASHDIYGLGVTLFTPFAGGRLPERSRGMLPSGRCGGCARRRRVYALRPSRRSSIRGSRRSSSNAFPRGRPIGRASSVW